MGYMEPTDLPIPVAACDPLEGDLLFGIEDPPDALRVKYNYEEPQGDGAYHLEKDAAATRHQLDRLARDIQTHVPAKFGPRFGRFIARAQAAMQLGINKQQMLDWFYAGRDDVDPFRIAAAGYAAEARWLATDADQPISNNEQNTKTTEFLKDRPVQETNEDSVDDLEVAEPMEPDELAFDMDDSSVANDNDSFEMSDGVGLNAGDMGMPLAASYINGDNRDYTWLGLVEADVVNPLPSSSTPKNNDLKANDEVQTNSGQEGQIVNVQPDGSFTVRLTGGTGNAQQTTYKPDALQSGEVKRKDNGSVSTIPALPAPTTGRKKVSGPLTNQSDTHKQLADLRIALQNAGVTLMFKDRHDRMVPNKPVRVSTHLGDGVLLSVTEDGYCDIRLDGEKRSDEYPAEMVHVVK